MYRLFFILALKSLWGANGTTRSPSLRMEHPKIWETAWGGYSKPKGWQEKCHRRDKVSFPDRFEADPQV